MYGHVCRYSGEYGGRLSVQNVVLGQLIGGRGYGYELAERLRAFSEAIELSEAAVYASLRSLEEKGLIAEVARDAPASRANVRVIFEATPAGREHFRRWMEATPRKAPLREELHMQLMVAGDEDVPVLLESLRQMEEHCRGTLARLLAGSLAVQHSSRARISPFGAAIVEDGLIAHMQTTIEWAQRSRRALANRAVASDPPAPGRTRP